MKNLKILIVEDDEASELFIQISVQKMSREILKVRSGLEAVKICRSSADIDLVLMDIKLPGIDGHQATREIRKFNKDVIIIAQTAFGLRGDREQALEAGCNDYIAKPIDKDNLLEIIGKYF